jgi:DNA-binding IclR family transcriptional regulator
MGQSIRKHELPRPARSAKNYPGRGYGRVVDVMTLISASPQGMTGSEIHRSLGLPKSTVFLLLRHLIDRRIVVAEGGDGKFTVGPALVQIAHQIAGGNTVARCARPFLEALAAQTTEDVYLGIRSGVHLIYVDKIAGTRSVGFDVRLGWPRSLHSTAAGKLFLAFSTEDLLDEVIREVGLPKLTDQTITDETQLRRELKRIRGAGYSISDGQNVEGVVGLAAPIRDYSGSIVAAVHISMVNARAREGRQGLIEAMLHTSREISGALGYRETSAA